VQALPLGPVAVVLEARRWAAAQVGQD
jgi:hypothetical protein